MVATVIYIRFYEKTFVSEVFRSITVIYSTINQKNFTLKKKSLLIYLMSFFVSFLQQNQIQ